MTRIQSKLSRRGVMTGLGQTLVWLGLSAAGLGLGACDRKTAPRTDNAHPTPKGSGPDQPKGGLDWAVKGAWRRPENIIRDAWLHPRDSLDFFGLTGSMTVMEIWPGLGYWTEILAPLLNQGKGHYIAALMQAIPGQGQAATALAQAFKDHFQAPLNRLNFGTLGITEFGGTTDPAVPVNSVDLVLICNSLHTLMAAGLTDKLFGDIAAALKPGGTLGLIQHRAKSDGIQDPAAANGYVQEAYVKELAAEAGLTFVASSEINANPKDTKNHPFGVMTLPPERLSAPIGMAANPKFNHALYDAIGESDRMTLKFRKPTA